MTSIFSEVDTTNHIQPLYKSCLQLEGLVSLLLPGLTTVIPEIDGVMACKKTQPESFREVGMPNADRSDQ